MTESNANTSPKPDQNRHQQPENQNIMDEIQTVHIHTADQNKIEEIHCAFKLVPEYSGDARSLSGFIQSCWQILGKYVNHTTGNDVYNAVLNGIIKKLTGSALEQVMALGVPRTWTDIRAALINHCKRDAPPRWLDDLPAPRPTRRYIPYIRLKYPPIKLMIDTGATHSAISAAAVRDHFADIRLRHDPFALRSVNALSRGQFRIVIPCFPELKDKIPIELFVLEEDDGDYDGILGMDLLHPWQSQVDLQLRLLRTKHADIRLNVQELANYVSVITVAAQTSRLYRVPVTVSSGDVYIQKHLICDCSIEACVTVSVNGKALVEITNTTQNNVVLQLTDPIPATPFKPKPTKLPDNTALCAEILAKMRSNHLDEQEKACLKQLCDQYPDIFYLDNEPRLVSGEIPFWVLVQRIIAPETKRDMDRAELRSHLTDMFRKGVIRLSSVAWNMTVWVVPEVDSLGKATWRLVFDSRRLTHVVDNEQIYKSTPIKKDVYNKCRYFARIGTVHGFHQLEVEKDGSRNFTFMQLATDSENSPRLSGVMQHLLCGLQNGICASDDDNIAVYSESLEEHVKNLKKVFTRLRGSNFKINIKNSILILPNTGTDEEPQQTEIGATPDFRHEHDLIERAIERKEPPQIPMLISNEPINKFQRQLIINIIDHPNDAPKELVTVLFNSYLKTEVDISEANLERELIATLDEHVEPNTQTGALVRPATKWNLVSSILQSLPESRTMKLTLVTHEIENVTDGGLRKEIIMKYHIGKTGHKEMQHTYHGVSQKYFWPTMKENVGQYVNECDVCGYGKLYNTLTPRPQWPFNVVFMDVLTIDAETYLGLIDAFSRYTQIYYLPDTAAPTIVSSLLVLCTHHSFPATISTYEKPEFTNKIITEFLRFHRIKHHITTIRPGTEESLQRSLYDDVLNHIQQLKKEQKTEPTKNLIPYALLAYNNKPHKITKCRPIDLISGHFGPKIMTESSFSEVVYEGYVKNHRNLMKTVYTIHGRNQNALPQRDPNAGGPSQSQPAATRRINSNTPPISRKRPLEPHGKVKKSKIPKVAAPPPPVARPDLTVCPKRLNFTTQSDDGELGAAPEENRNKRRRPDPEEVQGRGAV